MRRAALALLVILAAPAAAAPVPVEGDFTVRDFRFGSGETLPALRLHYATLGTPHRDASGAIDNVVLLLHGTGGTGRQFLQPQFADRLFGPGQPLDTTRFYIVHARRYRPRRVGETERRAARAFFHITPTTTWSRRSARCSSTASR